MLANDHVDLDVLSDEVHRLFGENGAGKSTLMRVLYGLYRPDEREIRIGGEPVTMTSPAAAIHHGIGMIHQHFMLVPTLTVVQNVALGPKSTRGPLKDLGRVSARIDESPEAYGLRMDRTASSGNSRSANASGWRSSVPYTERHGCWCSTSPPRS